MRIMVARYINKWRRIATLLALVILIQNNNWIQLDDVVIIPRHHQLYHKEMISSQELLVTDNEALSGYILSPNYPQPYPINASSFLTLAIYRNRSLDTIRLTFEDLDLHNSNHCEGEVLDVSLSADELTSRRSSYYGGKLVIYDVCGSSIPEPLAIVRKRITIRFKSDAFNSQGKRGFKIHFEFLNYETQLWNGCKLPGQFKCRNRRCINESLKCNRVDDCGDASDEDIFTPCRDLPTIPYRIDYQCGISVATPGRSIGASKSRQQSSGRAFIKNRIAGGSRTNRSHGWPFQVSIQFQRPETIAHLCGGTLIHPLFVLSAAHCFKGLFSVADYKFILGSKNLQSEFQSESGNGVQVRYASMINIYPGNGIGESSGLSFSDLSNDIALVELNAPVTLTSKVRPACLPHVGEPISAGRGCMSVGFGETHGTGDPLFLKQVEQKIVHSSECYSTYTDDFMVDDYSMICSRSSTTGDGPCNGDSGGPLFCADGPDNYPALVFDPQAPTLKPGEIIKYLPVRSDNDNNRDSRNNGSRTNGRANSGTGQTRYTVHGVTSFTTNGNMGGGYCGLDGVPIIYARISTKVEWILSRMKMALFRLGDPDRQQDQKNRGALFGYMFRSGRSRHENFTRSMTTYPREQSI